MLQTPENSKAEHVSRKLKSKAAVVFGGAVVVFCLVVFANRGAPLPIRPATREAVTHADATSIAKRHAPIIYLYPNDRYRPSSVEQFLAVTRLRKSNGQIINRPSAQDLANNPDSDNYLEIIDTIAPLTKNGRSDAPLYARVFDEGAYYRICYALFYPISGFQTFRISYTQNGKTKKRNFEWAEMAFHQGDWEHVQVWAKKDGDVIGIAPGAHGKEHYYRRGEFGQSGEHPILYSSYNTHAFYTRKTTTKTGNIPDWLANLMGAKWLKVVDTTEPGETTKEYSNAADYRSTVVLFGEQTVQVANDNNGMKWLDFQGRYGPNVDNDPKWPPEFGPSNIVTGLRVYAMNMKDFMDKDKFTARGPTGPKTKNWWCDKIPGDAPSSNCA